MKHLVVGALALLFASAASAQTVIIVRHAEKVDDSADPDLSLAGHDRAQALAASLADARVTAVLTTPLVRTGQTAAPTATAAGIEMEPISLEGGTAAHVARLVERIRQAGPDDTVLVAGHSNTVPDIARALGDAHVEALKDCDYDRLLVLRLGADAGPAVTRSRYGAPSAAC